MMLSVLCLALAAAQPAKALNVDYSGLPTLSSAAIVTQGANVSFTLSGKTASATELLVFKNTTNGPVDTTLVIPRFRTGGPGMPNFAVTATWNKQPLALSDDPSAQATTPDTAAADLMSKVHFAAGQTAALRIAYSTPFGTAGYGGNQYAVGFLMSPSGQTAIPQVNVSFSYTQHTVFDLPTLAPNWSWQIGQTGTSVRLSNFMPKGEQVMAKFYGGGFH